MARDDGTDPLRILPSFIREQAFHGEITTFVLHQIKALKDRYPNPVDLSEIGNFKGDQDLAQKVLQMLREQGFISGPGGQTFLTLKGYTSVQSAAVSNINVALFLSGNPTSTVNIDPFEVLLELLRVHVDT